MKKTLVSLAAASLIVTGAMAADKGVDLTVTGQAVIYYETSADDGTATREETLLHQDNSQANVGVQLNIGGDLGNNFTLGTQLSYLGTAGLEKNLVSSTKQTAGTLYNTTDELALTKIFVAKKVGNTTVKIGRQELPKSLSPLAFTEGWTVLKNTFDSILVVNTDVPDTTLVAASVGKSNKTTGSGLGTMVDPVVAGLSITDAAYMLTAQNKSLPMTTLTGSYYTMSGIDVTGLGDTTGNSATALWIDAKVAGKNMPLGLSVGFQYGMITPDLADLPAALDTTALGLKVAMKPMKDLYVHLAYSSVDDGTVAVKNVGTGVKTPLFTQMIYNQNAIAKDADTICVKGVYSMGDMGKVIVQYATTTAGTANIQGFENDYAELDLMYKVKSGGVQYFAALINRSFDTGAGVLAVTNAGASSENVLRVWARKAF